MHKTQNSGIGIYIHELSHISEPMSKEEEAQASEEALIRANLRFVISVARQFEGKGVPLEDLISAGNIGLVRAAKRFDRTRGMKFISYAVHWIRQAIRNTVQEATLLKYPQNVHQTSHKVKNFVRIYQQKNGATPTNEEISEAIEASGYAVGMAKDSMTHYYSIEGQEVLGHFDIAVSSYPSADEELEAQELTDVLGDVLATLDDRERDIVSAYFGYYRERENLSQIGKRLNLTRERVRQIRENALAKLRRPANERKLKQAV